MNTNELNLGDILVQMKRNAFIQDLARITKAASMEKGRKAEMLGKLKGTLRMLQMAAVHPNFADVSHLDKLSAVARASAFGVTGTDAFFGYPNKFLAYADIQYHISHIEWALWRVDTMKTS